MGAALVLVAAVTMAECSGNVAMQELPRWFSLGPYGEMGYHFAGWRCQVKRTPA